MRGMPAGLRHALALALSWAASGCTVHVYQPLSGLHDPVLVDPRAPNLTDVSLHVVCVPGDYLDNMDARRLCDRVGKLFEIQGARVTTATNRPLREPELGDDEGAELTAQAATEPTTHLVVELRSDELHTTNNTLSWALCLATLTLAPAYSESTFAQEVVIRDGTGFLLARDRLEGRIVRSFGLGPWVGNKVADWAWREKEDELSGKAANADLSADLYGQLSQLVFNARMRARVLAEAAP